MCCYSENLADIATLENINCMRATFKPILSFISALRLVPCNFIETHILQYPAPVFRFHPYDLKFAGIIKQECDRNSIGSGSYLKFVDLFRLDPSTRPATSKNHFLCTQSDNGDNLSAT